jgi:hypothetical protein
MYLAVGIGCGSITPFFDLPRPKLFLPRDKCIRARQHLANPDYILKKYLFFLLGSSSPQIENRKISGKLRTSALRFT